MNQEAEKKKLPKISYHELIQARKKATATMRGFAGNRMNGGEDQKDLVSALYYAFRRPGSDGTVTVRHKGKTIQEPASRLGERDIENSLLSALNQTISLFSAGRVLDDKLMKRLAYVIAGNLTTLRSGQEVLPWIGQPYSEWTLLVVLGVHRAITPKRKISGGRMKLHVMCGQASGVNFDQFFTDRALARMARHIGLRKKREYGRVHPFEFGQMKFLGRLKEGGELFIEEYWERGALNKRNRDLREKRGHGRQCPHNYTFPCHACHVGFVDCPLGTHQYTFVKRECPMCKDWSYFDQTDRSQKICLRCMMSKWRNA